MRFSTLLLGAAGAAAAVISGVATYSATNAAPSTGQAQGVEAEPAKLEPRVRFRPCAPAAELRSGVCVTRLVREVVVAAPAVTTPARNLASAPRPTRVRDGRGDDDRVDHDDLDDGHRGGEDPDDDSSSGHDHDHDDDHDDDDDDGDDDDDDDDDDRDDDH